MDSMLLFHKERIIPYLDDINEQAKSVCRCGKYSFN